MGNTGNKSNKSNKGNKGNKRAEKEVEIGFFVLFSRFLVGYRPFRCHYVGGGLHMMSHENSLQMTMVMIGLEEGERRGRMKALRDAAFTMSEQGVDFDTVARYLGLSIMNLRYLVNCTDWDICSTMCSACRINEPLYKK